jgi:hypothetical protein
MTIPGRDWLSSGERSSNYLDEKANMRYVCSSQEAAFRRAVLVLSAWVMLTLAGCESNPMASLTLYPVKGRVLLPDGKPLTSGRIVFVAAKSTVTSTATIESDGSFVVKGSTGDGLPEGDYRVRLEVDESKLRPAAGKPGQAMPTALPFPAKYADEDSSELTATVKPDSSSNNFEFKLTKQTEGAAGGRKGER